MGARTRRARRGLLAAAILAACVDGPTAPGRFGGLQIQPTFAAGEGPATLGVAVESAAVRITRSGDAAAIVDSTVAYATDTSSFAWILELRAETESLDVKVDLRGAGQRLYTGQSVAEVRDDPVGSPATEPVAVAYVGPPIVAAVTVTPPADTLESLGATVTLTAEARDRGGAVVPGADFTWTSDDEAVASVDSATGVVTAVAGGTATITATSGRAAGSARVTVNPIADVASIEVSPATDTLLAIGATRQFTARATDAAGNLLAGVLFTWSSSAGDVAAVDPSSGLATALAHGSTLVTAAAGSVTGRATLTVDLSAAVTGVEVTPGSATLAALGATQQFSAVARDAGGAVVPVAQFAWTTSAPNVAAVDTTTGLATAVGHGTTAIRAAVGSVFGEAALTVDLTASVASVTVTPAAATLTAVGATQQFTATARDAAGRVLPGIAFAWASTDTAVAAVDAATGLATARAHGTTAISATAQGGSRSGQARLTVDLSASIVRVEVIPESATLTALGATQQYTAVARDASGGTVPVAHFTWTSSAPSVGVVDSTGLATATGGGVTTITAAAGGHQNSGSLRVDLSAAVASITVTPAAATLTALGATQPFTAVARDAGGTLLPGVAFSWSSADTAVATVGTTSGLATAKAHGITTISATAGSVSGQAQLTVDLSAGIAWVEVIPEGATLTALGATQQYSAVAHDGSGGPVPVAHYTWASSDTSVGVIDAASGLATATGNGLTSITATAGGHQGTGSLRVDLSAAVASITVTPAAATLTELGATQQFTAAARDAGGTLLPGVTFSWSSADTAVASVGVATGLAAATGQGATTIRAAVGGVFGEADLAVDLTAGVASVTVTPAAATLTAVGAGQQFTATARDAAGRVLPGIAFAWASTDTAVAAVDAATGLATARAHGTTTISATAQGGSRSGQARLTVDLSASIARVEVIPESATLTALGATQQYTAVARDASGGTVPVAHFTWTSSAPSVGVVDSTGLATAIGGGVTTITAAAGGRQNSGSLQVDLSGAVASITVTPVTATLTAVGATQPFTAMARDADGTLLPGVTFFWSSSDTAVAVVGALTGLATARAHGTTAVSATAGTASGQAQLTVDLSAGIAWVEVIPEGATLTALGATQQYSAVAHDGSGGTVPVAHYTWASSDPAVGVVDSTGLATATGDGVTYISAAAGGHENTGALHVDLSAAVASITVTPAAATLTALGATQQFAAVARDAAGTILPGIAFSWTSAVTTVASVGTSSGLATAVGDGTTTISATSGSVSGQATLQVDTNDGAAPSP